MIDLRKEKAFKMVYEHYYDYIYNYFYYHTFQREVTEDLTSITFMKVLEKGNLYDEEKAKVVTWLLTIAKNVWVDHLRKKRKGIISMDDLIDQNVSAENETYIQVENQIDIQRLLGNLSQRERMIIVLHYYMNLSYGEIAMQLDISEKCASVTASRTLKKIKNKLEKSKN
ncbi:RNA polymerase sigma factor [uncultured Robinsoniella sp.]|uniref:RNA polymerase sigma factor n=1 Tax=uncultured Robinsoniella sp. TaxID=904190 RepID=UPI00374FDA9D